MEDWANTYKDSNGEKVTINNRYGKDAVISFVKLIKENFEYDVETIIDTIVASYNLPPDFELDGVTKYQLKQAIKKYKNQCQNCTNFLCSNPYTPILNFHVSYTDDGKQIIRTYERHYPCKKELERLIRSRHKAAQMKSETAVRASQSKRAQGTTK